MTCDTSRILIETVAKKALRDLKESPERSLRNLVDMAYQFSEGRFQRRFFETVQNMLKNEHSPYFHLLEDFVNHVDAERILYFGMNLGYNSCTIGARRIRKIEETEGYNIPWAVFLGLHPDADTDTVRSRQKTFDSVISQGEDLGIYSWFLIAEDNPLATLQLMEAHPDSAFMLLCKPETITSAFLDRAEKLMNLMLVIRLEKDTASVCKQLRVRGLLYSVYTFYSESDVPYILSGDLFRTAEQMHPVFTILLSDPQCPEKDRKNVYDYTVSARNRQLFQTILWEAVYDGSYIDSIISQDACSAAFGTDGHLYTLYEHKREQLFNLFENDLAQIFKRAFPKATEAAL